MTAALPNVAVGDRATAQAHDDRHGARPAIAPRSITAPGTRALGRAAVAWFGVTVIGQLVFVAYVVLFYGSATVQGRFETWNKVLPHGYVAGDPAGNSVVLAHLLFATFIIVSGALQLASGVRRFAPRFHHWNGRIYLVCAFVMSIGGLVMVWTRGSSGGASQHLAISLNAVLIMGFSGMAIHHALGRRFEVHRRWALRMFLAVSGVWFFRIGLMFWIVVNQGPVGFDPQTFRGPFLTFLAFAQYGLPLGVLELYFLAQGSIRPAARISMTLALCALTLLTAIGIAAATMMLWWPHM